MKLVYCLLIMLCPYISRGQAGTIKPLAIGDKVPDITFSQIVNGKSQTIPPLAIGDKVPDITFSQIVNGKSQTASLSQFKAKLIILDFWATWCSACLHKFALLDSLQQSSAGNLQVILVNEAATHDTRQKIEALFNRLKTGTGLPWSLPVMYNDTLAGRLFPHKTMPHYVWLNENYNVLAITAAEDITAANINATLNGHLPALLTKQDLFSFNRNAPLFSNGNGGNGQEIIQRSTITSFISGLPAGSQLKKDSCGNTTGIMVTNSSLYRLMLQAYQVNLPANRVFVRVTDSVSKTRLLKDSASLRAYRYCYELIMPAATAGNLYLFMQQDLQRSFGLIGKFQQQLLDCYIITADTALLQKFKSRGGSTQNRMYDKTRRSMTNCPLSLLPQYINSSSPLPVLNETGPDLNVDIDLHGVDFKNIPALQNALLPYGLYITRQPRRLNSFIIYNY